MSWYYFLFFQRYFQYDRATVILGSLVATRISYNVYSWLYHHDVPATIRTRESFFAFVKSIPILKDKIKALVDENKVMVSPTYTSINPYCGQFRTAGQSGRWVKADELGETRKDSMKKDMMVKDTFVESIELEGLSFQEVVAKMQRSNLEHPIGVDFIWLQ